MIDRFSCACSRIALFEPKKKSVTNTFRGTNSVRKRARAGLHRTSRVFRVEITRGFIERTRRRAGASFARRSKAEGNARVFARRDESDRRKKSSLFRCVGIFFDIFWDIFYGKRRQKTHLYRDFCFGPPFEREKKKKKNIFKERRATWRIRPTTATKRITTDPFRRRSTTARAERGFITPSSLIRGDLQR